MTPRVNRDIELLSTETEMLRNATLPLPLTIVGISKLHLPTTSFLSIVQPTFPNGSGDLSTLLVQAFNTGFSPCLDFWGTTDTPAGQLHVSFALFDEFKKSIGITDYLVLASTPFKNIDGKYVTGKPGYIETGSAKFVAPVVLQVTNGTWDLHCRPYGAFVFPC